MIDLVTYVKKEHPQIYDEYARYRLIEESKLTIDSGTKVVTLTSGYGGYGGQELVVLGEADWIDEGGVELIDYNGTKYGCEFKEFHKKFKIVKKFSEDWDIKDIEIEEDEDFV